MTKEEGFIWKMKYSLWEVSRIRPREPLSKSHSIWEFHIVIQSSILVKRFWFFIRIGEQGNRELKIRNFGLTAKGEYAQKNITHAADCFCEIKLQTLLKLTCLKHSAMKGVSRYHLFKILITSSLIPPWHAKIFFSTTAQKGNLSRSFSNFQATLPSLSRSPSSGPYNCSKWWKYELLALSEWWTQSWFPRKRKTSKWSCRWLITLTYFVLAVFG